MRSAIIIALLLAALPAEAAMRFALVIGNNVGLVGDEPLRYAERDAERLHELMTELGGVADRRAKLLLGGDTVAVQHALVELRGQIQEAQRRGDRTELFVFYSGHGDADSIHPGPTPLSHAELRTYLGLVPAEVVVTVLDACRTANARAKGATHVPAFDIRLQHADGPKGHVFVTSARDGEVAQESDAIQGSFFTHHAISGLRGAADANGDGQVTLAEFYTHAYNRTLSGSHGVTAAVQHPEMEVDLRGTGDLTITALARARSTLVLPVELGGEFLIVDDDRSMVIAEVDKSRGQSKALALPSGRFRIQLRSQGKVYAAEVALDWGGKHELTPGELHEQELLAVATKGSTLDPHAWRLSAASAVSSPTGRSGVQAGARIGVDHRLTGLPALILATFDVGFAGAGGANEHEHGEIRLAGGLAIAGTVGVLRLQLAGKLGGVFVRQTARSRQGPVRGDTLGPMVGIEGTAYVPLYGAFSLSLGGGSSLAWIRQAGKNVRKSGWSSFLGIAVQI